MTTTDVSHFESFAEIIAKKIVEEKTETDRYTYFLERLAFIKTINDIAVNVTLAIQNVSPKIFFPDNTVRLTIAFTAKNLTIINEEEEECGSSSYDSYPYYEKSYLCSETKESIAIVLKEMIDEIRILKFDKRDCRFKKEETINYSTHLTNMFLSIDNVETNLDKCCVCFEQTKALTSCQHCVCIPCADKIKPTCEDKDDEYTIRKCPICRQGDLSFMPTF